MNMLIYTTLAIAFLLLVCGFLRKSQCTAADEPFAERGGRPSVGNRRWLDLSERIFDPADVRWLAEELAYPQLANALMRSRKRLAIRWLEALQASFHELVCIPDAAACEPPDAAAADSWKLLWLTARFNLLIWYALLVVKVFGPYHRLIPSFSWVPLSPASARELRAAALAEGRSSD